MESFIQVYEEMKRNEKKVNKNSILHTNNTYDYKSNNLGKQLVNLMEIQNYDKDKAIQLIEQGANVNYQKNGHSPLMIACLGTEDSIDMIEILLKNGADVNLFNDSGYNALMLADDMVVCKYLLEHGADINMQLKGFSAQTVLMQSLSCKKTQKTKLLLEYGADVNLKDFNGFNSLMHAMNNNQIDNIELMRLLIDNNVDIDAQDNQGKTALMKAVTKKNKNEVTLLLENNANIDIQDNVGNTALMILCNSVEPDLDIAKKLIDNKASVNFVDINGLEAIELVENNINMRKSKAEELTILLKFAKLNSNNIGIENGKYKEHYYGHNLLAKVSQDYNQALEDLKVYGVNINYNGNNGQENTILIQALSYSYRKPYIENLIKLGADVNILNYNNQNSLFYTNNIELQELLIKNGVNINQKDNFGKTCLMYACIENKLDSIKLLVKSGAELNITDDNGVTAIMHACKQSGSYESIECLIKSKADVNIQDKKGKTALMYMLQRSRAKVLLLLQENADTNLQDENGYTALMIELMNYKPDYVVIKDLLKHGANVMIKDCINKDALFYAKKLDDDKIIKLIEDEKTKIMGQEGLNYSKEL